MGETARLVIPGRLPGLNEYIKACRTHRNKGGKMKEECGKAVALEIRRQLRGVRFDRPVTLRFVWIERDKRRDKDNISSFGRKVILDALVVAGVLPGDGWAHVDGFTDSFAADKNNPRIEVWIEVTGWTTTEQKQ